MSFCKPKDWDSCRVEKRGCTDCYFDDDENRFSTGSIKTELNRKNKDFFAKSEHLKDIDFTHCLRCRKKYSIIL